MAMRDPNTGAVLRDRFHQMRGTGGEQAGDYANMPRSQQERRAAQFLQSRGAPMTPQNLAIAHEYLAGGQLQQLGAQEATTDAISSQIDAADAGGGGGAGGGNAPQTSPRPQQAPGGEQPTVQTDEGGGINPGLLAGGAAAGMLASAAHRRMTQGRPGAAGAPAEAPGGAAGTAVVGRTGLDGEIVEDSPQLPATRSGVPPTDGSVVGLNYPQGGISGPGGAVAALPRPEDADLSGEMQNEPVFRSSRTQQEPQFSSSRTVQGGNGEMLRREGQNIIVSGDGQDLLTVAPGDPSYDDLNALIESYAQPRGGLPQGRITPQVDIGAARRAIP